MKRLLLICGLALMLAPAATARGGSPTLVSSCDPCATDGSTVTFTGSGYNDNAEYRFTVVTVDGTVSQYFTRVYSVGGKISFEFGPLTVSGSYDVRVYKFNGRNISGVSELYFTAQ